MFLSRRPLIAVAAILSLTAGCSSPGTPRATLITTLGAGLGSIGGGAAGSLIGSGTGQALATAGGAVVGGAAGAYAGSSLVQANATPETTAIQQIPAIAETYQTIPAPQSIQVQPITVAQPDITVNSGIIQPAPVQQQVFIAPAQPATLAPADTLYTLPQPAPVTQTVLPANSYNAYSALPLEQASGTYLPAQPLTGTISAPSVSTSSFIEPVQTLPQSGSLYTLEPVPAL